jgi:hypothetical protein
MLSILSRANPKEMQGMNGMMMRVFCGAALCGLLSQVVLANPHTEMPARQPSTGTLPVVHGVGSLTISGDAYWHEDTYADGEQPSLSPYDEAGQLLPDGRYRFEFRSTPQASELKSGSAGVPGLDLSSGEQHGQTVRGQFEMRGGQMIFD